MVIACWALLRCAAGGASALVTAIVGTLLLDTHHIDLIAAVARPTCACPSGQAMTAGAAALPPRHHYSFPIAKF